MLEGYLSGLEKAKKESKYKDKRIREGAEFRIKSYQKEIKELQEKLAKLKDEKPPEKKKRGRPRKTKKVEYYDY